MSAWLTAYFPWSLLSLLGNSVLAQLSFPSQLLSTPDLLYFFHKFSNVCVCGGWVVISLSSKEWKLLEGKKPLVVG